MSKTQKETQTIIINEKEYNVNDLTQEQINLTNHVMDLERKLNSARFNIDQLAGGKAFFMGQLEASLKLE